MARTTIRSLQERSYNSGDQAIVAGGLLVFAHGLGIKPSTVNCWLKCTTAEYGFSIGNETPAATLSNQPNSGTGNAARGATVVRDAINITVKFGSNANTFTVIHKISGVWAQITNANWKFIIEGEA